MEIFIILVTIFIVILIINPSTSSCNHDWKWEKFHSQTSGPSGNKCIAYHTCSKCDKMEECTFREGTCKCGNNSNWEYEVFGYYPFD